jgi:hypothetical protein
MSIQADRVHHPIATGELERRWKAIRAAMEERRIDVLVMQSQSHHFAVNMRGTGSLMRLPPSRTEPADGLVLFVSWL